MSTLYNFVKVKMQDTLKRKNNSMHLVQVKDSTNSNLRHEIETLERVVTQRVGKMKAAMQAGEAVVIQESRQAEQLAATLKADIAMLRANHKEAEEAFARKNLARQKIEDSLDAKLKSLQEEITKKEALLVIRENEITGYKSKIEDNAIKMSDLELKLRKTKEEAVSNAKCAEDLAQKTLTKVTALEAQLKKTEELARYQESSIQELKNELGAKAQEFDCIVKDKQELLMRRDSEINDLKSQLNRVTTDNAVGEIAAPEIFERIITEFSESANMMNTLASLIVKQQVKALGESVQTFPRTRLSELVESLAKDIENEKRRIDFRQRCN